MSESSVDDRFATARRVADAVLYEGYVLYPYRASSDKNKVRWQWGVVGPPAASAQGVGEEPTVRAAMVLEGASGARLAVRLRFLQVQARQVLAAREGGFEPVPDLAVGARTLVTWDEAVEQAVDREDLAVADLLQDEVEIPVEIDGGVESEDVVGPDGEVVARIERRRWPLSATLVARAVPVEASHDAVRVTIDLTSTTPWGGGDRDDANRRSLAGAHILAAVDGGAFVSLVDAPEWAQAAVDGCDNHRLWSVLIGEAGDRDVVLASPVILYDHPEIAPESEGDFFDATEIDEMLSLRVLTLTDEEKAEARATDPKAAAIVDRTDTMPDEVFERLHGAIRYLGAPQSTPDLEEIPTFIELADEDSEGGDDESPWWDPGTDAGFNPAEDSVMVNGVQVSRGTKVRLRPNRRADAHDLFIEGREATVGAVAHDVDGEVHVAVTVDDDPAADLNDEFRRYLYFAPDEVEPLETAR